MQLHSEQAIPKETPFRIALIGDIHTSWSGFDTDYFNGSDYDLILICGDLPGRLHQGVFDLARELSAINKPALMIPGNHDATTARQNLGEILHNDRLVGESGRSMVQRVEALRHALGPVQLGGYSHHTFGSYDLLVLRPHSIGGPALAFKPYLRERFAVRSLTDSAELIKRLIDECDRELILFGHNGPTGLGNDRSDIFGCDFRDEMGDFGDPDAAIALDYAVRKGKRIRTFLAGHMHHALRGGGKRQWHIEKNGIHFVNAACVPRIYREANRFFHHHIRLEFLRDEIRVEEKLISANR